ncbi:MAG: hypothetical protein NT016_02140 [Candidatus Aenigmarchaeota archaeon]|nr:hypothetical protein [Candidatus Aenigmarchaeota archaeon]
MSYGSSDIHQKPDIVPYGIFLKELLRCIDYDIGMMQRYKAGMPADGESRESVMVSLILSVGTMEDLLRSAVGRKDGSIFYINQDGLPCMETVPPAQKSRIEEQERARSFMRA